MKHGLKTEAKRIVAMMRESLRQKSETENFNST
jgi:hypothetical protein